MQTSEELHKAKHGLHLHNSNQNK